VRYQPERRDDEDDEEQNNFFSPPSIEKLSHTHTPLIRLKAHSTTPFNRRRGPHPK